MADATRIVNLSGALERNILIGMIVSTEFLKKAARVVDPDLFAVQAAGTVAGWVLGYFEQYREAPGRNVRGLYEENSRAMAEPDAEWVAALLASVSEQYEGGNFDGNEAFLLDRTVAHFKKRSLQVVSSKVLKLLDVDRVDEAVALWTTMMKAPSVVEDLGLDPFDPEVVQRLRQDGGRFGMSLGIGPLDALAGPLLAEWLVMVMGPMKRGKTQFLTHCALRAKMLGLNAVYINLESGYEDQVNRLIMAAGSMVNSGDGVVKIPVFDGVDKDKILYEEVTRPSVHDLGAVLELLYRMKRGVYGGRVIVKSFPSYTAGLTDIRRYLDSLEVIQGFSPHVICVDYLGAMRPPKGFTGRDVYDTNARGLKSLSEERKALVISAHQGSRRTLEAMNMSASDVPEDVRILGHVDVLCGLNQTEEDKIKNVMRMNVLMHRFRRFNRFNQVKILQQPEVGQFCLDAVACDAPLPKDVEKPSRNRKGDDGKDRAGRAGRAD